MSLPKRLRSVRNRLSSRRRNERRQRATPLAAVLEQLETRAMLAANQAPVNVVPGSQTVQVNQPLAFTEFRANAITTSDADAGLNNAVVVTLTAEHGVVTLNYPDPNGGLTYSVGDGTEDVTMTFTGKLTDINTALQWVVFQPDVDYVGTEASLTITTNDQGYLGTGGAKQDTDTIPITVTAVPGFADSPTYLTFPAALDASFGTGGMETLSVSAGIDSIRQMRLLPDGKIIAVGAVNNRFGIMRFNSDLTLDTTFGTNGVTMSDFGEGRDAAWEIIPHPEGGWLVSGRSCIARYTDDGQLDASFGTNGRIDNGFLNIGNTMAITADGKLLVGGWDGGYYRVSQYTLDGVYETQWEHDQSNGGDSRMRGVIAREDGDILLLGNAHASVGYRSVRTNFQGGIEYRGSLPDLGDGHWAENTLLLPNNKILIVGQANGDAYIGRWNADGSPDTSFGTNGAVQIPVLTGGDLAYRPTLQPDGKIILVGQSHNGSNWDINVIRMSYDGVLDTSFDSDGIAHIPFSGANDYGLATLALPDGKILVAGITGNDIALVRLLGDSDQSAAAANQAPVNVVPGSQTVQVNQPLAFTEFRANAITTSDADAGLNNAVVVTLTAEHGVVTLNYPDPNGGLTYSVGDGTEDVTMTFTGKLTDINTALQWVVFQPDVDYVGTEASLTITTNDQGYLGTGGAKQDTDTIPITVTAVPGFADSPTYLTFPAALDASFGTGGMETLSVSAGIDSIRQMRLLPDGKIIAVGAVNNRFGIMRFNSDLTLDTTFGTNGVTMSDFGEGRDAAWEIIPHPEGGWLVSGRSCIARYTDDGQLDASFGTNGRIDNGFLNIGNTMAITADGKLLVGGWDGGYYRVSQYTLDGVYETQWEHDQSNGGDSRMRGVIAREDGDILLLGNAHASVGYRSVRTNFQGGIEYRGSLPDLGDGHWAENTLLLPNNKILIVGQANGDAYIGRWNADGSPDTSFGTNGAVQIPVLTGGDLAYRPTLQPDGKIILVGQSHNGSNWDINVIRMSYDGVLDTSFDSDGIAHIPFSGANDYGLATLALPDGKILVAGITGNDIALVRLLGDFDLNSAPEEISLSASSIDEDKPSGSVVGTLSTSDPDEEPSYIYSLVAGDGDTDNASFEIVGDELKTKIALDYETKTSYSIRIQTEDGGGKTFQKVFTITVNDVAEGPTGLSISAAAVPENSAVGTVVGNFTTAGVSDQGTCTYTLVTGSGDTDNNAFSVSGNELKTAAAVDFETQSSYSIRVRAADGQGGTFEKSFTITVADINDAPSAIAISTASVPENAAVGTEVGVFSTTDQDAGDTFTYAFVAGTGDTDNALFEIVGDKLTTKASFDFETKATYSIRVRSADAAGLTVESVVDIAVTDVNEAPTAVSLAISKTWVPENYDTSIRRKMGTIAITDDALGTDTITHTGADADSFEIDGNGLYLKAGTVFDHENQPWLTITVTVEDTSLPGSEPVSVDWSLEVLPPDTSVIEVGEGDSVTDTRVYTENERIVKRGKGQLILTQNNTHSGGIQVDEGEVVIRNVNALNAGPFVVRGGARAVLDVGTDVMPLSSLELQTGGLFDLGAGGVRVAANGFDEAAVRQALIEGRNGGTWDASQGLIASAVNAPAANAAASLGIGYFEDQSGTLTIRTTANGDAQLDGKVDFDDILALFPNYNAAGTYRWQQGDFTYDGKVDFDDILALFPNYGGAAVFGTGISGFGGGASGSGLGSGGGGTAAGLPGGDGNTGTTPSDASDDAAEATVGPQPPDRGSQTVTSLGTRPSTDNTAPATNDIDATSLAFAALATDSGSGKPAKSLLSP